MKKRLGTLRHKSKTHKAHTQTNQKPIRRVLLCPLYVLALIAIGASSYTYLQNIESFEFNRATVNFEGARQRLEVQYQALQNSINHAETILATEPPEDMNNSDLLIHLLTSLKDAKKLQIIPSNIQDNVRLINQKMTDINVQIDDIKKANIDLKNITHQVEANLLAKAKNDLSAAIEQANVALQKAKGAVYDELKALIAEAEAIHIKSLNLSEVREKKTQLATKTNEAQITIQSAAANALRKYAAQPIRRNVIEAPVAANSCPAPVIAGLACYSQKSAAWADVKVGAWKFGPTGCVPTAVAMVMHKYGSGLDPLGWGRQLYNVGLYNYYVTGGTSDSVIWAANSMSLWHDNISSLNVLVERLQQGYPVIALVRPPYTTPNTTHAIVLNGYNGWQTQVLDPLANRVSGWHSVADIFAHRSDDIVDYGTTGTVFTAIGYAPTPPPPPPPPPEPPEPSEPPEPDDP